jgi:hypothetical protein
MISDAQTITRPDSSIYDPVSPPGLRKPFVLDENAKSESTVEAHVPQIFALAK